MASVCRPLQSEQPARTGHRHAGEQAAQIAHVVERRGAVLAEGDRPARPRSAPQATASTVEATARASVNNSSVTGVGPLSPTSASTHTLPIGISDHLQLLEEGHDVLRAVALVHHDLSCSDASWRRTRR